MTSKSAGKIEHRHIVEREAIVAEHHMQAGDVGSLRLGQFVDVALEEEQIARLIERETFDAVIEAAHLVHAPGAQQFAHQVDEPGTTDPLGDAAANHAERERP